MSFGKQIEKDPECIKDFSKRTVYIEMKEKLKKQLFFELTKQKDPRILGNGDIFDKYEFAETHFGNFYERTMKGEDIEAPWLNGSDIQDIGL